MRPPPTSLFLEGPKPTSQPANPSHPGKGKQQTHQPARCPRSLISALFKVAVQKVGEQRLIQMVLRAFTVCIAFDWPPRCVLLATRRYNLQRMCYVLCGSLPIDMAICVLPFFWRPLGLGPVEPQPASQPANPSHPEKAKQQTHKPARCPCSLISGTEGRGTTAHTDGFAWFEGYEDDLKVTSYEPASWPCYDAWPASCPYNINKHWSFFFTKVFLL